jgi:TRAP-type C4-dicarboxylate transport system permease large subunit
MPVIIVGKILSRVFTPTEAGAVAVGYTPGIRVSVYDEPDLGGVLEASHNTVTMSGVALFILVVHPNRVCHA